jgi:hypothetical protein
MQALGCTFFDTAVGRCGIAWSGRGLVGVQLPEATEHATRARLRHRFPSASETQPPTEVQRALDGIVALLRGESCDLAAVALDMMVCRRSIAASTRSRAKYFRVKRFRTATSRRGLGRQGPRAPSARRSGATRSPSSCRAIACSPRAARSAASPRTAASRPSAACSQLKARTRTMRRDCANAPSAGARWQSAQPHWRARLTWLLTAPVQQWRNGARQTDRRAARGPRGRQRGFCPRARPQGARPDGPRPDASRRGRADRRRPRARRPQRFADGRPALPRHALAGNAPQRRPVEGRAGVRRRRTSSSPARTSTACASPACSSAAVWWCSSIFTRRQSGERGLLRDFVILTNI